MTIIYGSSKQNIKNALSLLTLNKKITNKFVYDDQFDEILALMQQNSLFDDPKTQKCFIIEECEFLTKKTKQALLQTSELLKVNQEVIVTIGARNKTSFNELIQKDKSIKWIKATSINEEDKAKIINDLINQYQIQFDDKLTKDFLIQQLSSNWNWVNNELNKVALLNQSEIITKQSLEQLLFTNHEENVLALSKLILAKNKKAALNLLTQLMKQKVSEINIINVLAVTFFEFKLQKRFFMVTPYSQIRSRCFEYGWYPNFIYQNYHLLKEVSLKQIDRILNELLTLDYQIKTNQLVPSLALKLFLLNNY